MQFIYADGDLYYFMDQETYEQTPIHQDKIGDGIKFLKEEMVCKVVSYKGDIFQVELPITVVLEITECEPGVKGDTANNASKYATLETGAVVKVPLFVNQGEKIKVDTRTGEYESSATTPVIENTDETVHTTGVKKDDIYFPTKKTTTTTTMESIGTDEQGTESGNS